MNLAFHGATTQTSNLETDVSVTAQAGYEALEVWAAKIDRYLLSHSLADLNFLFSSSRVDPITINSIEFIAFRGSEFAEIQARLHELGRVCQAIGCKTVVVVASPLPDRQLTWPEIKREYVHVLRQLSEIAFEHGINLSFEFLGFGWCSVRTPRAASEIIQEAACENIGMTLDAAHFYTGGGLISEISQLDPQRIFAFHLNDVEDGPKEAITDARRLLPGLGVIPLGRICAELRQLGYNGPCSIELFRPEYWDWDPLELATKARQAALRVLSPFFPVR